MKQIQQIATFALASLLTLNLSGCSEKDEPIADNTERGIAIESITATLQGMDGNAGTSTRATTLLNGFSVNRDNDPTIAKPEARSGWKMDFTTYKENGDKYTDGSFTGATYSSTWKWTDQKYFPNYKKPQAEALIYPNGWSNTSTFKEDQSATNGTDLLAQDILFKEKGAIDVAHKVNIEVKHMHSMLDFVIKDVVIDDIDEVKVFIGNTDYTPYKIKTAVGTGDIEYMLILSETTATSPVVQIKTKAKSDQNIEAITYQQTIGIIADGKTALGSNKCYCFTLQGDKLDISPVTVLNWATGESLPGEYIAVTAYPTFKAEDHADETFYFYYDNQLKEDGQPKLQEIKFNENAECTIKPDGRILTHIYKSNEVKAIDGSTDNSMTPNDPTKGVLTPQITLGQMVVNVQAAIASLK